ncbi:MAG: AI-2E family transporter [Betaproteobacteria bacterium]|nr:AI-2E family transporter [Betaproteobacteria bacterium]
MTKPAPPTVHEYAAWTLAVLAIFFVLKLHLLPALIAGLLVYELVHVLFPLFTRQLSTARAKMVAVGLVALLVIGAVTAAGFGIVLFMKSEGGSLAALLAKMAEILESSRATLPQWLADYLPIGAEEIRTDLTEWLREHAAELQLIGKETGHMLAHMLIGMVIGAMVAIREAGGHDVAGPLAQALEERIYRMGEAFRRIVFAQVRISAINTAFTALYLAVVLPLFGVHLPLTKTMIAVTFAVGLLPVVGNLISNAVIFVVSLAHSPAVAVSSLAFLIVIHKLEYFLNARIVGARISAKAWELLTAMLVLESAFGLPGLVAAPICYAWLKDELGSRGLV